MTPHSKQVDRQLFVALCDMLGWDESAVPEHVITKAQLPISMGGIGMVSMARISPAAYAGSWMASGQLVAQLVSESLIDRLCAQPVEDGSPAELLPCVAAFHKARASVDTARSLLGNGGVGRVDLSRASDTRLQAAYTQDIHALQQQELLNHPAVLSELGHAQARLTGECSAGGSWLTCVHGRQQQLMGDADFRLAVEDRLGFWSYPEFETWSGTMVSPPLGSQAEVASPGSTGPPV